MVGFSDGDVTAGRRKPLRALGVGLEPEAVSSLRFGGPQPST